ncbi:response regulator transcription factor [Clostridium bowmanii]|uniref:response regulator n=1 Tax=Clostridium bowmanii TaxID=132925 RepID=UPI001C0D343B|nr:response regulator transcription factor [Clostridium bowmanii]MBU3191811.1 response regulator transcription factor [Clostridium bowmanii]MCA1076095.1 response regulator transcription factor [Clostridium bowmanii]
MRVLIVDDDRLVCVSLKVILESDEDIEVVALGYNGKMAVELYEDLLPDILLIDIRMEIMTGLKGAEIILASHKEARILFLTTFLDDEYIIKALKIGSKGYLLKQNFESIIPCLKAVQAGQTVFGDEIITKIPSLITEKNKLKFSDFNINEKEFEIIAKVADGLNNKEISEKLYLSEGTIRNYISTILEKLSLRDRTQLAIFYYKNK